MLTNWIIRFTVISPGLRHHVHPRDHLPRLVHPLYHHPRTTEDQHDRAFEVPDAAEVGEVG